MTRAIYIYTDPRTFRPKGFSRSNSQGEKQPVRTSGTDLRTLREDPVRIPVTRLVRKTRIMDCSLLVHGSAWLRIRYITTRERTCKIIHSKATPNGIVSFGSRPACRSPQYTEKIAYASHDLKACSGDARRWPTLPVGSAAGILMMAPEELLAAPGVIGIPADGAPRLGMPARARVTVA